MNIIWGGEVGSHSTGTVHILNSVIIFPTCRDEGVGIFCCIFLAMELKCAHCLCEVEKGGVLAFGALGLNIVLHAFAFLQGEISMPNLNALCYPIWV